MQTSADNIDWTLATRQRQKFIIACCLPLALIEVLPLLYLFSEAAIELVQVVFHPRSDSSPIIVLVVKFGADPLCPLVLILCYYDQSSCFRILLRHSCRVINWPHVSSGWCDTRGNQSRAGKWKNNAMSFGLQKENCDHCGYCLHLHYCRCLRKICCGFSLLLEQLFCIASNRKQNVMTCQAGWSDFNKAVTVRSRHDQVWLSRSDKVSVNAKGSWRNTNAAKRVGV